MVRLTCVGLVFAFATGLATPGFASEPADAPVFKRLHPQMTLHLVLKRQASVRSPATFAMFSCCHHIEQVAEHLGSLRQ